MSDQQVQVPADLSLTVTLTYPISHWRAVVRELGEGKHNIVGPIIQEIDRQCGPQIEKAVKDRVNGGYVHTEPRPNEA